MTAPKADTWACIRTDDDEAAVQVRQVNLARLVVVGEDDD